MTEQRMIVIGDIYFDESKKSVKQDKRYDTLYDAYAEPSRTKKEIWKDWLNWFNANSESVTDEMYISSRNFCKFTISGEITVHGVTHEFIISASKQHVYVKENKVI